MKDRTASPSLRLHGKPITLIRGRCGPLDFTEAARNGKPRPKRDRSDVCGSRNVLIDLAVIAPFGPRHRDANRDRFATHEFARTCVAIGATAGASRQRCDADRRREPSSLLVQAVKRLSVRSASPKRVIIVQSDVSGRSPESHRVLCRVETWPSALAAPSPWASPRRPLDEGYLSCRRAFAVRDPRTARARAAQCLAPAVAGEFAARLFQDRGRTRPDSSPPTWRH